MAVEPNSNTKRIAKNTVMLYFRMLLTMVISLYTSRVVLSVLGVEDYGIYNAVGGAVVLFGFINGAMITSTQRFLNFELGRGDTQRLGKVFSTSVAIHAVIAMVVVILCETVGLWLLNHKMTIPPERMEAAHWVFHISIVSTVITILSSPYNAAIVAHEKMSAFAYISIVDVTLKLLIVYLLTIVDFDKLILYAILIMAVQLGIRLLYTTYCRRHFQETKFRIVKDRALLREMASFAGWNIWGNCAGVAFTQGLNVLLNIFFDPAVSAARAVAVQVQGAVSQFSTNFQMAINPQITKSFAAGDREYMHSLIFRSSKFTFFILLMLVLPLILEAETVLDIWLKNVPQYSSVFLRLILCVTVIDAVANPLMISAQASGKVKVYQSVVGGILLAILPISYVVLKLGGDPASVFVVHLAVCAVAFVVRLLIVRPLVGLSLGKYFRKAIFPCIAVLVPSAALSLAVNHFLPQDVVSSLIVCAASVVISAIAAYTLGLNKAERGYINEKVSDILHLKKRA